MKRFLVIGDLNVDIIVSGMPRFPELGQEIQCNDIQVVMGGSASIFACRLAQLGSRVDIFGVVGNDNNGRLVLDNLRLNNVDTEKVMINEKVRTGITLSLTYPNDKALVTFPGSIGALEPSSIRPELFGGYDHLHVSSIYFQPKLLNSLSSILGEAKSHGLTVSIDPQNDPSNRYEDIWQILEHTDIFLPNDREAKDIAGSLSLDAALDALSSKVQAVAVKRGSQGAIAKMGERRVEAEPIKIHPVDTTGAGDSFDAGFIHCFVAKNHDLEASLRFANAMGALSCLYVGGAGGRITEQEVLKFLKDSGQKGGEEEKC